MSVEPAVEALVAQGQSEKTARQQVEAFVSTINDLLSWLSENGRQFPWRQTTDPWHVYIAEILLQRTHAEAVTGVYETFLDRYPNPMQLADATENEIYDVVKSLGFGNQRTRTLQDVALVLVEDHSGAVPKDLDALKKPWRVGPYCARATMMFAFGIPMSLVDRNFARVAERVFDYSMPSQPHKDDQVQQLLEGITPMNGGLARAFNLAILDLGALVCLPSSPECNVCPFQSCCVYGQTQYSTDLQS
ncbi:hypothetical protein ACNO8S_13635 [Haloarcula sp. KBTZ06]|uniref:hypothetical protein n=1 Tax=Haloarcula sp. KBTZ06 TaxID=3402682 RepID=UPI003B438808